MAEFSLLEAKSNAAVTDVAEKPNQSAFDEMFEAGTAKELILERAQEEPTDRLLDSDILPKTVIDFGSGNNELTSKSLGSYLENNFRAIDTNENGNLDSRELKAFSEKPRQQSSEQLAFANQNYFALKSLSNDSLITEQGITKKDINQLYKNQKPETSIGEYISSSISMSRNDPMHWAVNGALIMNAIRTLHPAVNAMLITAWALKTGSNGYKFHNQLKNVSELYKKQ